MGQREVLGDELAKEHGEDVDEGGRHEGGDAGRQPPRQARAPQQACEQVSQGALRRVPQQDRRQRDAHLGAGELGGQGAGGSQDGGGAPVPLLGAIVEHRLIDCNEGELGGHEHEGPRRQEDAEQQHRRRRHRPPPLTRPGRVAGEVAGGGPVGVASKSAVSQSMMVPV